MKRLFITLLSFLPTIGWAQHKMEGIWQGGINRGNKTLTVVFRIKGADDNLSGTMDSPDQGVTGIPCYKVSVVGDSLIVDMSNLGIIYSGKINDDTTIAGAWHQRGLSLPLSLNRTAKPVELVRPQTPKPPFPYKSEDVVYYNKDKSIQYGATITIPQGKGSYPAVLLITGSGQQNRDEELFGHKPFAVIADYLTRKGYIVMRVDDRGVGQTTGDALDATTADFAKDVNVGVDYLRSRKEVNKRKIGLMGHSEGGIIAPMVASERKDIDFIVLLAGAGVKMPQLMEEQSAAILEGTTADQDVVKQYSQLYRSMEDAILEASDSADARNRITLTLDAWVKKTPASIVEKVGLNKENVQQEYIKTFTGKYTNKWFHNLLTIDPKPYLEKLSCKVLAINGSKDVQVVAKTNLAGIKQALAKSKSKAYEVKELPGLNHLFQTCKTCSSTEYGELEETMSPVALKTIGDWLDKNVK